MAKEYISAPRSGVPRIIDPACVYLAGIDGPEDLTSVTLDRASNDTEIPDSFVDTFGRVAAINKAQNKGKKGLKLTGNVQAVTIHRIDVDPSDPNAYVDDAGVSHPYRIDLIAGRKRTRSARAWNEKNNLTPASPDYVYILVAPANKRLTDQQAVEIRLIENRTIKMDPVSVGKELKRLAHELAKQECAEGAEPTKKAVSSKLGILAALNDESKATVKNKVNLSERLPQNIQDKIVNGDMPATAGYLLAVVNNDDGTPDHEAQSAIVESLSDDNGRVKYADVKQAIADKKGPAAWKPTPKNLRALSVELEGTDVFGRVAALALRVASGDAKREDLIATLRGHLAQSLELPTTGPNGDGIGGVHAPM